MPYTLKEMQHKHDLIKARKQELRQRIELKELRYELKAKEENYQIALSTLEKLKGEK